MARTSQPKDSRVTDVRVGRWDALLPSDGEWTNLVVRSSERKYSSTIGRYFSGTSRRISSIVWRRAGGPCPLHVSANWRNRCKRSCCGSCRSA